ncbi:hypothetical protein C1O66_17750 [Paucibacter aquatile]|uniref:ABC transporter domain-containing protein n=1 Tax=Kinneretia aquatilis TaxID=2070761 RepID=A0A2N8L0E9_9BURK|nr:ABC transporter ATP-binding protein [Paucibacter aquatile]PND39185.1 hypothetical protein C1O66_17750 [Paucibacter aquatile]
MDPERSTNDTTAGLLLQLQQASKHYTRGGGSVQALDQFDLELKAGEVIGLLGPNGSGKTTLVKILTGLCDADQGELRWRKDPARAAGQPGPHLREIGVLLEGRGAAYERLTTLENARYFCELREQRFSLDRCRQMADLLGLSDLDTPIRQLSTGNKLRAALIGALIHRPALVLLDEPTLGLDLEGVERLHALVHQGAAEGQTFLIGSHDLHFIERLCPRIVCIHRGRKRFDGAREAFVHQDYRYRLVVRSEQACPPPPEWLGPRDWQAAPGEAGGWSLPLRDPPEAARLMAEWAAWLGRCSALQLRAIELREHYLEHLGLSATEASIEGAPTP